MPVFEPRRVAPDAWKSWCRLALELQSRIWLRQLLIAAVIMASLVAFNMLGHWILNLVLMIMIAPLLIAVFILVSVYADRERWILPPGRKRLVLLWRIALSGVLGWFIMLLLLVVVAWGVSAWLEGAGSPGATGADRKADPGLAWPHLFYTGLLMIMLPLMAFYAQSLLPRVGIWFCLPLMLHNDMDLLMAFRLSQKAEQLNWSATNMVTMISLVSLGFVLISGGILAMVVLPFLGALHYVSYRDVFLGMNKNAPRPVTHAESAKDSMLHQGHGKWQSGCPCVIQNVKIFQVSTNTVHKVVDK